MRSATAHILRRLRSEERGQSLIIVSLAMVVVMGVSAMAIDVASWYQKHHQAQVIADSAALAAANCLANPNTGSGSANSGPVCTSSTDVTDAQDVAIQYAKNNGLTIPASAVVINTSTDTVQVTAKTTAPGIFANMFGIKTTTQTADSTAGWSAGSSTCTTADEAAGECYAIYAQNAACGSTDGYVVNSASVTITGVVHTQGTINFGSGGGTYVYNGPITYSTGDCSPTWTQSSNMTKNTPTAGGNEPATYWPINYATVFPACSATGTYQCTTVGGVSGVPSYCTQVSTNSQVGFEFGYVTSANEEPMSGNVYCSIGSGNASNPATWNGPITFSDGAYAGSSGSPLAATFIGGYINVESSNLYLEPAANTSNCLFYVTDTDSESGSYAINFGTNGGTYNVSGTMFAPNGTISITATPGTAGFLEAQNVDTPNLSYTGDGPVVSGSSSSSGGSDSLEQ